MTDDIDVSIGDETTAALEDGTITFDTEPQLKIHMNVKKDFPIDGKPTLVTTCVGCGDELRYSPGDRGDDWEYFVHHKPSSVGNHIAAYYCSSECMLAELTGDDHD